MGWIRSLVLYACATAWVSFGAAEARDGRWLRAESAHFVVISDSSEVRLREAVQSLEVFDQMLRSLLGAPPTDAAKLEVYLFLNQRDLTRVWPGARDLAGFYWNDEEVVAAFAFYRDQFRLDAQETLFHEYGHHFLFRHASSAYPGWFIEGYAEFVQTARIEPTRVLLGNTSDISIEALQRSWLKMEDVLRGDTEKMNYEQSLAYYAQSWLFVHYIFNTPARKEAFDRYLAAIRGGADSIEAFEPAFGVQPGVFARELRDYLSGQLNRIAWSRGAATPAEMSITRLPESADDLMLLDVRMRTDVSDEDRDEVVGRVRALAARFPGDTYATRVLANAEIVAQRPDAARALLAPLIAEGSQDWEAFYLAGLSYIVEADLSPSEVEDGPIAAQSRRYFGRAFRINPNHSPTLYFYAVSYLYEDETLPAAALDVLIRAQNLSPQVWEIGTFLGEQLMLAARYDEAVIVLKPFASLPHSGEGVQYVRRMLEAAQRREPPPPHDDEKESDDAEASRFDVSSAR